MQDLIAEIAERVAAAIVDELSGAGFQHVDWNDLGDVTIVEHGRVFKMTVIEITDGQD